MLVMLLQHFRFRAPDGGRMLSDPGIDAQLTLHAATGGPILMRVELT